MILLFPQPICQLLNCSMVHTIHAEGLSQCFLFARSNDPSTKYIQFFCKKIEMCNLMFLIKRFDFKSFANIIINLILSFRIVKSWCWEMSHIPGIWFCRYQLQLHVPGWRYELLQRAPFLNHLHCIEQELMGQSNGMEDIYLNGNQVALGN